MGKPLNQEEFLAKAKDVCDGRIDLSRFVYAKSNEKSLAKCLINLEHSDFLITPNKLLAGAGCPECAGNKTKTLEKVYSEICEIHGDKYQLTQNSKYIGTNTKMELFCSKCKEIFYISPKKCKSGQGHRKCSREQSVIERTRSFRDLLLKSDEVFGPEVFLFEEDTYVNWNTKVGIWCRVHGRFEKTPVEFFSSKYGCHDCWVAARGRESHRKYSDSFINMAREVHGDTYDYSQFIYVDAKTRGVVICKKHGPFSMTPDTHLGSGCGCPKCSHTFSKAQEQLTKYIESFGVTVIRNFTLPDNTELDIYLPTLNLAFEYNGLRWHSDKFRSPNYHLSKTRYSRDNGIRLIHIFEDEWLFKRSIVEGIVRTLIGKETIRFDARKCKFQPITWKDYKAFVDLHHLQGAGAPPSFSYGLFLQDSLVAVMGFSGKDCKEGEIELVRFCSRGIVRGGFSKLLHNSLRVMPSFSKVVSFSDTRWSQGEVYSSNGFILTKIVKPDYWYVSKYIREDKRAYQRKYLPLKLAIFDESLSERLNCAANGIYRVFDCGKRKWELKLP